MHSSGWTGWYGGAVTGDRDDGLSPQAAPLLTRATLPRQPATLAAPGEDGLVPAKMAHSAPCDRESIARHVGMSPAQGGGALTGSSGHFSPCLSRLLLLLCL
ncbi:hypothetical protein SRHO_G00015420 [Serrasalmus rhombeus]